MPGQQIGDLACWVIGDPGEHVGKTFVGVEAVELGGLDQRVKRHGAAAAGIGACEQIILAADGNHGFILPVSGKK